MLGDYDEDSNINISAALPKLLIQISVLKSLKPLLESSFYEFRQLVTADLFDSELDSAHDLLKKGFVRGAGVIAGVVLEKHLKDVSLGHNLKYRNKNPSINDYNELLKQNEIIDIPTWRRIQWLADIRNICGHQKEKDPTKDDDSSLIDGVNKIIKTVF